MSLKIKSQLYKLCLTYIEERIATAQQALEMANSSANEETKSSAGDKYETTREMIQQEIEKHASAIAEAVKQKQLLQQINPERITDKVQPGSLVITDKNNFYIAISAGSLLVDGTKYTSISPSSPIGIKMIDKTTGETFAFNGNTHIIKQIA
jgi:transcription elongation GreA/GreB family factor